MLFSRLAVGDGVGGAALAGGVTAERRWIVGHCHRCECCSLAAAAAAEQRGVLILKINAHKEEEEKEKEEENPNSRFLPSLLCGARHKMPSPRSLPLPRQLVSEIVGKKCVRPPLQFSPRPPRSHARKQPAFPFPFRERACCLRCPPG